MGQNLNRSSRVQGCVLTMKTTTFIRFAVENCQDGAAGQKRNLPPPGDVLCNQLQVLVTLVRSLVLLRPSVAGSVPPAEL